MKTVLGIDPGKTGAIVLARRPQSGPLTIEAIEPMPESVDRLVLLCGHLAAFSPVAWIEQVTAVFGTGRRCDKCGGPEKRKSIKALIGLHRQYGEIMAACSAAGIPREFVAPVTWQSAFGLKRTDKSESDSAKKGRHLVAACEAFPGVSITKSAADAVLIAKYGLMVQ